MLLLNWLQGILARTLSRGSFRHVPHSLRRHPRPRRAAGLPPAGVEALEDRTLLSTITVTSLADGAPGNDGSLTLREAILIANDNTGGTTFEGVSSTDAADTIEFAPGLASGTITLDATLAQPLPTISSDLTITGLGADQLTLDANGANISDVRGFRINAGVTATISGLTITGGNATNAKSNGSAGGGILNQGTLTLVDSVVTGNHANNSGGGIRNTGTLHVLDSAISANTANEGAGIASATTATVTVTNSTISANTASGSGGGIMNFSGTLTVVNSTITQNRAGLQGTGIENDGTATLHNTIVAGNFTGAGTTTADDINGAFNTASSHNLIGDGTGATGILNNVNGNQRGTITVPLDPQLGPLQNNGGPTPTHAPLAGSTAINAGDNARALDPGSSPLLTDQRGPGFARIVDITVDIGALEFAAVPALVPDPNIDAGANAGDGTADTFVAVLDGSDLVVTANTAEVFRQALADTNSLTLTGSGDDDSFTLDFTGGAFSIPIVVHGGGQGAGGDALSILGTGGETVVYTPDAVTFGSGAIDVDGRTISFTGLEPVDFDGVDTFTLDLPGSDDVVIVTAGTLNAAADAALVFTGTSGGVAFESAHVRNTVNVVVDTTQGGDGDDTITIASADNAHGNTNLQILTGSGADAVTIDGAVSLTGTFDVQTPTTIVNNTITAGTLTGTATTVHVSSPGRIQDAIDLAGSGGTVSVAAGTYSESVSIDKDLTLTGATGTAADVVLDPPAGNGIEVLTGAGTVVIRDLRVTGAEDGVHSTATGVGLSLDNVELVDNTGDGLESSGGGTVVLTSVTATGNSDEGLEVDGTSGAVELTNVIAENNLGPAGLTVDSADSVTISGGSYSSNSNGNGITLTSIAGSITLANVTADGNGIEGLGLAGAGSAGINGGSFSGNGDDGVDVSDVVGTVELTGVTADANDDDGADIQDAGSLTITNGSFSSNDDNGLKLSSVAGGISLTVVTADANGFDGADVDSGGTSTTGDVTVTGGSFSGNDDNGLDIDDVAHVIADSVTADNNLNLSTDGAGLFVESALSVSVTNGSYSGNGNDGIELDTVGGPVSLTGVTVENSTSFNGVNLDNIFGTVTITAGSYSGNATDGIDVNGAADVVIADGTSVQNNGVGLNISNASSLMLSDLVLTGNAAASLVDQVVTIVLDTTTPDTQDVVELNNPLFGGDGFVRLDRGGSVQDLINFTGVDTLSIGFLGDDDVVNVAPHPTTQITLDGGDPVTPALPGDSLNYLSDGVNAFVIGAAVITTVNHADITHSNWETITIDGAPIPASTTTALSSDANPSDFGQLVTFTATVDAQASTATPTGTVVFTIDGSPSSPVSLDGSGVATFQSSTLTLGTHSIEAEYTPDSSNFLGSSDSLIQAVSPANPDMLRFDFNNGSSPTQSPSEPSTPGGYIGVRPTDLFIPSAGFGWLTAPAGALDRGPQAGAQPDLLRDFHYGFSGAGNARTFRVELQPGEYVVNVTIGDASSAHDDIQVSANGTPALLDVDTARGQFFHGSFTTTIGAGGVLDLELSDAGGDPFWVVNGLEIRPASAATGIAFAGPGSVTADGSTADTIIGSAAGLADGTLVTVSTTLGTIITPDASPQYAGIQVVVNSGQFAFSIQRPNGGGLPTLSAAAIDGSADGTVSDAAVLEYTGPSAFRFDFGSHVSPVQPPGQPPSPGGYIRVLPTDLFDLADGFGWLASPPGAADRGPQAGAQPDLRRDFHYGFSGAGGARTFEVTLPDGTYFVNVTIGDATGARDNVQVSAEGVIVLPDVDTSAGRFFHGGFESTVNDGRLTIEISDNGGNPFWVLNGLEIRPAPLGGIAFTTSLGAVTADGTTIDTISGAAPGLPDGSLVTITTTLGTIIGDASTQYAGTQAIVSGGAFSFGLQRPFGAGTPTLRAEAIDGAAEGQSDAIVTYAAPAFRRYDFNASSNDTAAGFIGVRGGDLFNGSHGWLGAAASELLRGTTGFSVTSVALYRDFHFSTAARTFRVDVGADTFDLRAYTGDRNSAHDNVQVSIEGGAFTAVSTPTGANVFTQITLLGVSDRNGDGFLDITFSDLGGDPFWVINGFDLADAGQLPATAPLRLGVMPGTSAGRPVDVDGLTDDSEGPDFNSRLQTVVVEAIARFAAAGFDTARLQSAGVHVVDIGQPGVLGLAGSQRVLIDDDAAGHGWFIDATPDDDDEFFATAAATELLGIGGPAAERADLLTVVMHEFGHLLGFGDVDPAWSPHDLMAAALPLGTRRVPMLAESGPALSGFLKAQLNGAPVSVAATAPSFLPLDRLLTAASDGGAAAAPADPVVVPLQSEWIARPAIIGRVSRSDKDDARRSPEPWPASIPADDDAADVVFADDSLFDLLGTGL